MYCSQCGYLLQGLSVDRCPECGRTFDPRDPSSFEPSALRVKLRPLGRMAGQAAVGVSLGCTFLTIAMIGMARPGLAWRTFPAAFCGGLFLLAVAALCGGTRQRRFTSRASVAVLGAIVAGLSAVLFLWPLWVTLSCYTEDLQALAAATATASRGTSPVVVGPFVIRLQQTGPRGAVYLWTELSSTGPSGLMRCPPEGVAAQASLRWYQRVTGDWYLAISD